MKIMSNPKNPPGNFPELIVFTVIIINKKTLKRRGSERMFVNANAETNGIVKI